MKEKVDLAASIQETGLLPSNWIYDNVFHFSEDQYDEYRDLVAEDKKRLFRMKQIEEEGNDPAETGQVYGTPHQLANAYGTGRYTSTRDVPPGFDENDPNIVNLPGRPEDKASFINTQKDPFGRDRLGVDSMKGKYKDEEEVNENIKAPSSTQAIYLQNKNIFNDLPRKTDMFKGSNLLNEDNIREELK